MVRVACSDVLHLHKLPLTGFYSIEPYCLEGVYASEIKRLRSGYSNTSEA
jgi:hypothetical protein